MAARAGRSCPRCARSPRRRTWSFPPRPWTSHVRWIAPSPHDAARLLVGIELGGVMLSEDGGETWKDHRPGAQPDCHALAWHPERRAAPTRPRGAARRGAPTAATRGGAPTRAATATTRGRSPSIPTSRSAGTSPRAPDRCRRTGRAAPRRHLYRWRARARGSASPRRLPPDPLDSMPYALCVARRVAVAGLADGRVLPQRRPRRRAGRRSRSTADPVAALLAARPVTAAEGRGVAGRPAEIEVLQADITKLDVDAIANAANTELKHGGGVAGAIVRAGGPRSRTRATAWPRSSSATPWRRPPARCPSKWVIHAATMELGGPTSAEIIRRATASTLRKADELGATSLGLVAFGTGVGGFPLEDAARIEVEEVRRHLDEGSEIERVVFAVFGDDARGRSSERWTSPASRPRGAASAAPGGRSSRPGSAAAPRAS